jgi:predicted CXXCH cytochrome family protein
MNPLRMIVVGILLTATAVLAQTEDSAVVADTALCLDCHDFGSDSPVHAVLSGSHGISGDAVDMAGRSGCPDCHGTSTDHAQAPNRVPPDVSFGPRWSATPAAQDGQCLACHEENVARNWKNALHMLNNLTCITCHDVMSWQDKVLFEEEQAKVCTICHKNQKQGIHGLKDMVSDNPPCSDCHNPHDHESAEAEMRDNDSLGCRHCHDPDGLPAIYSASEKAKNYHKVMAEPDHTCLDCHRGISHVAADSGPATPPIPVTTKNITLFYPGMADSDWLLRDHPGSQPLRQGRNCQQCHRGEEATMGQIQASGVEPAFRHIQVSFSGDDHNLRVSLSWQGPADDTSIALMWGGGGSEEFRRGGCFAACHSDLPGMSRDRGDKTTKYLWASRTLQQRPGQPSPRKDSSELEQLTAAGEFVEVWQVDLETGRLRQATLLADLVWQHTNLIQINKSHKDNRWVVELTTPLDDTDSLNPFSEDGKYTFGIALNSAGNPGGKHWVSLPMTMSFAGDDTDFKVE